MKKYRNTIEFEVYGPYALFSDPVLRVGGEKPVIISQRMRRCEGSWKAFSGSQPSYGSSMPSE